MNLSNTKLGKFLTFNGSTTLPSKIALIGFLAVVCFLIFNAVTKTQQLTQEKNASQTQLSLTQQQLTDTQASLSAVLAQDQYQRNEQLEKEIKDIHQTYQQTVLAYENILDLKDAGAAIKVTQPLDALFTQTLIKLSNRDYIAGSTTLAQLKTETDKQKATLATTSFTPAADAQRIQEAPGSGYRRQAVDTSVGTFQVDIVAGDLNSTRVQVETASEGNCRDGCPVSALGDYVARSGGYAGINGPYFCPAEYPSCAGKTNSFDTLLMNKNKVYFNSDNNVYSTVPAVIFSGSSARYVGQSSEWGRDTGVDAVIANQPLLLSGGQISFGGDGDPKKGSRGSRSFIGSKGSTVYIGVVRNATVAEVAIVLQAMGLESALNLDSGGSTALYTNGRYVAGPGRQTPFGIVLVQK
jgi:exopolysaccharide biosynthesis protein